MLIRSNRLALGGVVGSILLFPAFHAAADASVAHAAASVPPVHDISHAYLTKGDGSWGYRDARLQNGNIAPSGGLTPDVVIPAIEGSGARFVKVAHESPPDQDTATYYDELHAQTPPLQLGVRLNVRPEPGARRTVAALLGKARRLRDAPPGCTPAPSATPCYFDWIFLDGAMLRSSESLQRLVDGLRASGPSDGGGWQLIMSNDTGWPKQRTSLPRGEWAHAHSLGLLHTWNRERKRHVTHVIRHHPHRVITRRDRSFIREVRRRDPGSHPVLKFEVHTETDRLQTLRRGTQIRLLRELSAAQYRFHFRLVYPLFVGAAGRALRDHCGGRTTCRAYNSLQDGPHFARKVRGQGTYVAQKQLMLHDRWP